MNEDFLVTLVKLFSEGVLFLIVTVILFNEFTQVLINLNVFTEKSTRLIGTISLLLAADNLLFTKFLGINIFK